MHKNNWSKAVRDVKNGCVHKYVEGQTIIMNEKIKNYWTNRARKLFESMEQKLENQICGLGNIQSNSCPYCAEYAAMMNRLGKEIDECLSEHDR
jgi:Fe-S cluster biosynthesis and repair protein YggX